MLSVLSFTFFQCEKAGEVTPTPEADAFDVNAFFASLTTTNNSRTVGRGVAWADCDVYDVIVTPATFKPDHGNFDELYTGGGGFLDGIMLISDSKPRDRDYNGGRWHLNVLKEDVDPAKYTEACSDQDLDLSDFQSMPVYFECPLLPRRGNGPN